MPRSNKRDNLLGQSNTFLEVLDKVSQAATLNKPVLIIGERGTGKELIAARLHFLSTRWEQNYITLNCAALNENLLESELFGHEAGSFTGSGNKRHEGRFERAHNGTLFLDELANTSGLIQEKLLRTIEYGEFERVGGNKTVKVDTRLIAATNEDLPALCEIGEFREDLLDRLAFDVITLPPLRARQEDILLLAEHFAIDMARQLKWELFSGFSRSAKEALLDYQWPGNVRELKNVVERSVYRSGNPHIPVHDIVLDPFQSPFRPKGRIKTSDRRAETRIDYPIPMQSPASHTTAVNATTAPQEQPFAANAVASAPLQENIIESFPVNLKELSNAFEIEWLNRAMKEYQYNQKKAATSLGMTYHQFRGYLKKYQLLQND